MRRTFVAMLLHHKTPSTWVCALALLPLFGCNTLEQDAPGAPPGAFLFAGQSNAVGFDSESSSLPPSELDVLIPFWWRCGDPPPDDADSTGGGWTHLGPQGRGQPLERGSLPRQYGNFAHAEGGYGPEVPMMRALAAGDPPHMIAAIKVAFSGTSIKEWSPDEPIGPCYQALLQETREALRTGPMRPRALVWIQGESDANAEDAPHYGEALSRLIAGVRRDLAAPDLVVLLAVNTRFGMGENPFMPDIVAAQEAVATADPFCVYVDTSEATIANGAHFDSQGTLDVGRWLAAAYVRLSQSVPPSTRSPRRPRTP